MKKEPRRAVIYARLSKDVTKEGAGVARQIEDARALADLRGFAVVGEHVDNDISAAGSRRRPGFDAMIADLESGRAGVVIAWAWDRLSRNRRDTVRLMDVGQEHKVVVALVRGSDLDMSSANGRMLADILASVARGEIDNKAERQERANLQRAQQGKPPSRRAFGYLRDGSPHPTEAPAVAEVFGLYLAGSTMVGLAKTLNAAGLPSTRGKAWEDTGIRVILTNTRYIGERRYQGVRVAEGCWPSLVSDETFAAVQQRLSDSSVKKRRPARRYLGGGLFVCHCGAPTKISYDGARTRVYVCSDRSHMQRKAEPVEDLVYGVIAERLRRQDLAGLSAPAGNGVDVAQLRRRALGYRSRLDGLAQDYADGVVDGSQLKIITTRIKEQLTEIEGSLAEAGKSSALASIAGAADLGGEWLRLPLDRQRAVLDAVATVVILPGKPGRGAFDPDTVRFDWKE